ncbi:MAG: arginine decarboxylase, pyruvoyl-dependent [Euryarchaeota archaeon RBG_13_57_23]|nr:MAG: arginine decarboxylase, pyruvoyl-dependent [Euryarchaeota archaeon RBG_13_57_23]
MRMIPKKLFFTKGVGRHKYQLQSFELALRDAGIEKFNLVSVSSILPAGCQIVPREEGLKELRPGQIVFVVMARNAIDEPNRMVASSIGCAVPADGSHYGYLSEHHAFGENAETAGHHSEDLAATMLATTLGIEFDSEKDWDEREDIYKMSGKIVKSLNVTKTAEGDKGGLWTTVVAAAVFVTGPDSEDESAQSSKP